MKHVRALTLARKGGVIASEKTLTVINYLHKASLNLYYEACNISQICTGWFFLLARPKNASNFIVSPIQKVLNCQNFLRVIFRADQSNNHPV